MDNETGLIYYFTTQMNGTKWIILGILLLILEVVTGTTYILWPAIAALIAGVVTYLLPLSWQMQYLLFFIIATALLIYGHLYVRPRINNHSAADDLNDRGKMMIGQIFKAAEDFDAARGRVQVGDTQWLAQLSEAVQTPVRSGDTLRVISVKGTTLFVEPA